MSLKIQNANLTYANLIIENTLKLDDILIKLEKFSEFVDSERYVAVDFTLLDEDKLKSLSEAVLEKILKLKFKILFIKSYHSINKKYDKLINNDAGNNGAVITNKNSFIFNETKVINSTVRSGEEVINIGDIIVNALISYGAEIKSSGNIHVYGECRGKLFAGINGDETARIYVNNFNAEAVGIAGVRYVFEDEIQAKLRNKSVFIHLDDKKRINVTPMKLEI